MQSINHQPSKKELRNFGFVTGGLTPVFFGLLLPWIFEHDFPKWPWIVGTILAIWGLCLPKTIKPVFRVWMTIGNCLGWVNTRIILSIMFYLIILPAGILMRLFGKDPMARDLNKERKSYRVTTTVPENKHMERPY